MLNSRQETLYSKLYIIHAALASLIWVVLAWIGAYNYVSWQTDQSFVAVEKKTRNAIAELQEGLERTFSILHSVPNIISRDRDVKQALHQTSKARHLISQEERRILFEKNTPLTHINKSLSAFVKDLGVISIIWVMKPDGIVIAASNAGTPDSFVGADMRIANTLKPLWADNMAISMLWGDKPAFPASSFLLLYTIMTKSLVLLQAKSTFPTSPTGFIKAMLF